MSKPSPSSHLALLVMGVSGSGKTTIGQDLARRFNYDFVDGDDLHPAENVAKMSRGEALGDADRRPWLVTVGAVLGNGAAHPQGIVVACSALRRVYRDHIRAAAAGADLTFLFLDIPCRIAKARLENRKGHFMPASLVDSQFETLERPGADEPDVVTVIEADDVEATIADVVSALKRRVTGD